MQARSSSHQVIQIVFVVLLMGFIAWLATGWQEQEPLQLGFEQETHYVPWSEAHLVIPVTSQTPINSPQDLKAM